MKGTTIIGIVLIVLGIAALALGGFSYTDREKVLDIGPIEATTEERKTIPIPAVAGGAAVVAGVVLVIAGARSKA
jgi:uncharacterized membrane protein YidH (DUF202 family)